MIGLAALALLLAADVVAEPIQPTIAVLGVGRIEMPPDMAMLSITIRGEGKTADEASADLARKQKAIFQAIGTLSPDGIEIEAGDVSSRVMRSATCRSDDEDDPVLSTGACAIIGYVVSASAKITMTAFKNAGTAVGLANRLGAVKAEISGFGLKSPGNAMTRANNAAFASARAQAESIATAGGLRLGPVLTVRSDQTDIVLSDSLAALPLLRWTYSEPTPVKIDVMPGPVVTTTRLNVVFAIGK